MFGLGGLCDQDHYDNASALLQILLNHNITTAEEFSEIKTRIKEERAEAWKNASGGGRILKAKNIASP